MRGLVFALTIFFMSHTAVSAEPARYNNSGYFEFLQRVVSSINADDSLKKIINDHNSRYSTITADQIQALDQRWRKGDSAVIDPILNNKLAQHLANEIKKSNDLIAEIIIMGAKGLNVAAYPKTTDFFQGDEAKWQETFAKGPTAKHVGKVGRDDSTEKFLEQISQSLIVDGKLVGAITIGFDITAH